MCFSARKNNQIVCSISTRAHKRIQHLHMENASRKYAAGKTNNKRLPFPKHLFRLSIQIAFYISYFYSSSTFLPSSFVYGSQFILCDKYILSVPPYTMCAIKCESRKMTGTRTRMRTTKMTMSSLLHSL